MLRVALCRSPISWVALALLAACSGPASPEQQVRAVIDSMETAVEARGYFVANQSVHLLTRIESLEFPSPDEARVKLQVGMAGRGGQPGASSLNADLYDFDLALVREGDEWKVSYADWRAH